MSFVALLGSACSSGAESDQSARLTELRKQAALAPCPPALGNELQALTLTCIGDGSTIAVSGAPGRPLLVNFYNTICPPCQSEFPLLAQYQAGRPEVGLVGVDALDDPVSELAFVRDFQAVSDPEGELFRRYAGGWPVTVAFRADGSRGGVHVGELTSLDQIKTLAKTAL